MQTSKMDHLFIWSKLSKTKETTYGQNHHNFTANGNLWGNLALLASETTTNFNSPQSQARATITLNQYPAISAQDRLTDSWGNVWIVDGVRQDMGGKNETILECHKFDSLNTV